MTVEAQEHRWCSRKHLALDVNFKFENRSYRCRTRNLCLGGLFVDLGIAMIPPRSHVQIEVDVYSRGKRIQHRFNTMVAHATLRGYGLSFREFNIKDFRVLQELLHVGDSNSPRLRLVQ